MARFEREPSEFIEKVVCTNRVSKTVKGGRVMKFSALMVVGDGKGKVGFGLGKAAEVPEAIRKGIEDAKKNMITISLSGSTIPHEIIGEKGAGRVLMKPAAPGYRRDRRWSCAYHHGSCRREGHPYQVPALQHRRQRCRRHLRGPEGPAHPGRGRPHPRQERRRDRGLRRREQWLI